MTSLAQYIEELERSTKCDLYNKIVFIKKYARQQHREEENEGHLRNVSKVSIISPAQCSYFIFIVLL